MALFTSKSPPSGMLPPEGKAFGGAQQFILAELGGIDSSAWKLKLVSSITSEHMQSEISRIAASTTPPNPFFDYPFLSAASRRLQPEDAGFLVLTETLGDDEQIRFFAPVASEQIGFPRRKILKVWSHMFAPSSAPLVDEHDKTTTFTRLSELVKLVSAKGHVAIVFEDFLLTSSLAGFRNSNTKLREISRICCHTERAALNPWQGKSYVDKHLSPKRRRTLRRNLDKLAELGSIEFEKVTDLSDILVRFEEFLLLETRGWKGRVGTSLHRIKNTAAFARQSVVNMTQWGNCSIYSLRLDGKAVASLIVFETNGYHFPWKIAYDEEFARYSVGNQLVTHFNQAVAQEEGFRGIDSLAAPNNKTANRFWPDRLKMGSLVIGFGHDAARHAEKTSKHLERIHKLKNYLRGWMKRDGRFGN